MADYNQYDPAQNILIVHGHIITGFAPGSFITAERDNDSFTDEVGADGSVTRVKSHDKRGTITITLMGEAPSNNILSAINVADELIGSGSGNVKLTNLNSATAINAANGWVMKPANFEAADTTSPREWKIRCASLSMFIGGAII